MHKHPQNYTIAIAVSLLIHAAVAFLLFWKWPEVKKVMEPVPKHVIAEVVQVESAAEKERKIKAEQERRQRERAAQQRQRQKELAAKKAAEEKRKQQALKEKALAEKRAKEKALAEQRAKEKQAEAQKQKELAEKRQKEQEESLLEKLLQEERMREQKEQQEAQRQAKERAAAMVTEFTEKIRAHTSSYWSYPSVVKPDDEVTVNIQLVPTGEVVSVQIVKGSGNALLDNSVLQAVRKASPLPVPKDIQVFEKDFRNFIMKFRPENASW